MNIYLKPCPFCGAEPGGITKALDLELVGFEHEPTCYFSMLKFVGKSISNPFWKAWNTRAEGTCRMLPGRPYYDMGEEGYTCSECGSWANLDWVAHYCPNCGAKVVE